MARGVAAGQDQARRLAERRTDGAEDVGGTGALVVWSARPSAAAHPAPGDLVLLPHPGLILKPDLDHLAGCLLGHDDIDLGGEVFLKVSAASWSCA